MITVCYFPMIILLLFIVLISAEVKNVSYEDNLKMWYGSAVYLYADEYAALAPEYSREEVHAYVRSIKVAAFFDAVQELNNRISALLLKEGFSEYAQTWQGEAVGHILGSVDKITALQNAADNPLVQSICETGFNVGYSAINFLLANPRADFISFDIFMNRFGPYAVRALQDMFPSRSITVVAGDSTITVPSFLKRGQLSCDLVFVDGGTPLDRNKDIGNFRATANLKPPRSMLLPPLNVSFHQASGHMQVNQQRFEDAAAMIVSTMTQTQSANFATILIVDDMDPIYDGITSHMRNYYEENAHQGYVRTRDEFHLRYTPCVRFDLDASHPHGQYMFDTSDSDYCKQSWTSAVDGTVQRPDWRAGYFVVSEYVTSIE